MVIKIRKTIIINIHSKDILSKHFDVFIGRGSKWGNKNKIGQHGTRKQVVEMHREDVRKNKKLMSEIEELRGKILGCYCKPLYCHGDIYLELLGEKYTIKQMETDEEKEQLIELCKKSNNKEIKKFPGYWTWFKNWKKSPPIILIVDNVVVAFMAFTLNKSKEVNFYSIAVDDEHKRHGYAYRLWERLIELMIENNMKWLKIKAVINSDGDHFFRKGLMLDYYKIENNQYVFLTNVENIKYATIGTFVSDKRDKIEKKVRSLNDWFC